ncbi:serine hydrolase domain-containing protein [Streptomyces sp. ID05-47C]|uniref:serine hydrolase domain-containing protein n=1 Tax=Streptomyces sp. ID05-47C TaxID=3028665 RepID=UPI0029B9DB0C|nr:serine hydrolase domain-containing protein [Streptomyces sp. ID05-47C]MDX3570934.1 serine hydrolase [Streptomyces sp. ID05-47C]
MTSRERILILVAAVVTAVLCVVTPAAAGTGARAAAGTGAGTGDMASARQEGGSLSALLDELVPKQLADYRIPGASVVVVDRGGRTLTKGYGLADVEREVRSDPRRTGYFMASDAKLFTAVAVLQQVEKGKLSLDADVNRYLTAFKVKDSYPDRPVTVRHLLTHTAGFDTSILGRGGTSPEPAGALGESLDKHQPKRVRPPGEVASYDNYGVALAGYLVEQVTGTPFATYVDRAVLTPLGMTRTTFARPDARTADALALGYRPDGGRQRAEDGQYGAWTPTGAGAVTTAADMGRLMSALLDGGGPVLTRASTRAMLHRQFANDPRLPGVGYLLEERQRAGERMWVKDGDLPGFHGNLALLPASGVGVYVVYNGDGVDGSASYAGQELVNRVADRLGDGGKGAAATPSATTTDRGEPAGKPSAGASAQLAQRDEAASSPYSGYYRTTRTSTSDLTRVAALTTSVHVTADAGGALTTTGLARDPRVGEQHWVPVAPGVFQERAGQDRIAFRDGRLALASDPTQVFEKLPWYQSPALHQQALLGGLAVLGAALLLLPLVAYVRRRKAKAPGGRLAWTLAWVTGAILATATVCFIRLTGDGNALNRTVLVGDSPLLTLIPHLVAAAAAATALLLICTVVAWRRGWWPVAGRVTYTCHALAATVVVGLGAAYGLLP